MQQSAYASPAWQGGREHSAYASPVRQGGREQRLSQYQEPLVHSSAAAELPPASPRSRAISDLRRRAVQIVTEQGPAPHATSGYNAQIEEAQVCHTHEP